MAIVDDDIERIRSTVSIVDVDRQHVQLQRTGRNWVGLCPFHAERRRRSTCARRPGATSCFGCDAVGRRVHVRAGDRARRLRGRRRAPRRPRPGSSSRYTTTGHRKERARRKQLVEAMAKAVEWYHDRLLNDPTRATRRDYLRSRGLAGDVARQFKIGWAPDDWDALRARRRDRRLTCCATTGWRSRTRRNRMQDAFRARVLFPIFSENGERGRRRWADPAGIDRPGEVQELAGDADLHASRRRCTG